MVWRGQKSICPTCDVLPLLIRKATSLRRVATRKALLQSRGIKMHTVRA